MGDTYGAWEATLDNGEKHLIVAKAYASAHSLATGIFGAFTELRLVGTDWPARWDRVAYRSVLVDEED